MLRRLSLISLLLWTLAATAPAQPPSIAGSFEGALKVPTGQSLRLRLHIDRTPDGALKGALDSVDQGAFGIPIDEISFAEGTLRWSIQRIRATFEGKLSADGAAIEGTFTQGMPMPLTLQTHRSRRRQGPRPPPDAAPAFPLPVRRCHFPR
jgi:uncharacterized protein